MLQLNRIACSDKILDDYDEYDSDPGSGLVFAMINLRRVASRRAAEAYAEAMGALGLSWSP